MGPGATSTVQVAALHAQAPCEGTCIPAQGCIRRAWREVEAWPGSAHMDSREVRLATLPPRDGMLCELVQPVVASYGKEAEGRWLCPCRSNGPCPHPLAPGRVRAHDRRRSARQPLL